MGKKHTDQIIAFCNEFAKPAIPLLRWLRKYGLLGFIVVIICMFFWKAIVYIYGGEVQATPGEAFSMAFMEMCYLLLRFALYAVYVGIVVWILYAIFSFLRWKTGQRSDPQVAQDEPAAVMDELKEVPQEELREPDASAVKVQRPAVHPLRPYLDDAFCGRDDEIFQQLLHDIETIKQKVDRKDVCNKLLNVALELHERKIGQRPRVKRDIPFKAWALIFLECVGCDYTLSEDNLKPGRYGKRSYREIVMMEYLD